MFCLEEIFWKFPFVRRFLMYFRMFLMYLNLLVHVTFKNELTTKLKDRALIVFSKNCFLISRTIYRSKINPSQPFAQRLMWYISRRVLKYFSGGPGSDLLRLNWGKNCHHMCFVSSQIIYAVLYNHRTRDKCPFKKEIKEVLIIPLTQFLNFMYT